LDVILADVVLDPFVEIERTLQGNNLLVHYAVPLIDGDDVFVELKGGTYTAGDWSTQTWSVRAFRWQGPSLVERWTALSDWKPVPMGSGGPVFEPVFHPVLANGSIYMPGGGGSVLRVDRDTGRVIERIGTLDSDAYVTGPMVADSAGNVYYNAIVLAHQQPPWMTDIRDARLTRIDPGGGVTTARYVNIATGAPAGTSPCLGAFGDTELPWPPSPGALPGSIICGSQRPGINVAPAIAPDGTIYTVSRAHFNSRWSYLIALNPDLTPKWTASLRDRFNDGCNVLLPSNGSPGGCRAGAATGVDPADNTAGAGRVLDESSASPLVAPDGTVFYGAYTRYNYSQGHLMHFTSRGAYLGSYPFGWDITPAIYAYDNTYSILTKENHYPTGSYCGNPIWCPDARRPNDPEGFFVTQLDSSLRVEWMFRNPRNEEWCVNAPAIDRDGVIYMNAEDGFLYSLNRSGSLRSEIRLTPALGQTYTPLAIDDHGRIYAQKAGHLFVVGARPRHRAVRR
jgi:outer membrane protein assembly factor BamB